MFFRSVCPTTFRHRCLIHFGSLWAPFCSSLGSFLDPLAPFGFPLAHFGSILVPFWSVDQQFRSGGRFFWSNFGQTSAQLWSTLWAAFWATLWATLWATGPLHTHNPQHKRRFIIPTTLSEAKQNLWHKTDLLVHILVRIMRTGGHVL